MNVTKSKIFHLAYQLILGLALLLFVLVHLYDLGGETLCVDEAVDYEIAVCYAETLNPFGCDKDFSQARLPYYIHASMSYLFPGRVSGHYAVSYIFGGALVGLLMWFARSQFGKRTEAILLLMLVTSFPLLTATRTILTYSNIIFTFFVVASVLSFYFFIQTPSNKRLVIAALLTGLAAASNIMIIWAAPFYLLFYLFAIQRPQKKHLLFVPIVVITFFIGSVFYLAPGRFIELVDYLLHFDFHPEWWNYFNLGSASPPWYYGLLLFAVKVSPLLVCIFFALPFIIKKLHLSSLQKAFIASIFLTFSLCMFFKPVLFHYDAPHHHVHFYVLAYLVIAIMLTGLWPLLKKPWQRNGAIGIGLGFVTSQLVLMGVLFPHLSFYGAQYGKQFYGDIYGPAAIVFPNRQDVHEEFNRIRLEGEKLLFPVGSIFANDIGTYFPNRDPDVFYKYAFNSWYTYHHLHNVYVDEWDNYLEENCEKYWSYVYPFDVEIYAFYECKPPED